MPKQTNPYAFVADDAQLRAFVLKHYGSNGSEIDGCILAENMAHIVEWIKTGTVPVRTTKKMRTLKVVPTE